MRPSRGCRGHYARLTGAGPICAATRLAIICISFTGLGWNFVSELLNYFCDWDFGFDCSILDNNLYVVLIITIHFFLLGFHLDRFPDWSHLAVAGRTAQ